MGTLVEQLLVLAQLDELPEARRVPVDLSDLAVQVAADARVMAPDRDITVDADGALEVVGDPDALRQVLGNLMVNAVIHTTDGTPVELSVRAESPEVVIRVRDHGGGIPAGAEGHVFDRFWRAEGGRARGPGGSGLGLSIVKELVQSHHGSVRAETCADGGALFTVRLPEAPGSSGERADLNGNSAQPVSASAPS